MKYLKASHGKAIVPKDFPDFPQVKAYTSPLVSGEQRLKDGFADAWAKEFDEEVLRSLLAETFLFGAKDYMKWIVQTSVVKTLVQEMSQTPGQANHGQERNSERLQLRLPPKSPRETKSPALVNATFLVTAATTLDLAPWAAESVKPYIVPERSTVKTLGYLLERVAVAEPEVVESPKSPSRKARPRPNVSKKRKDVLEPGVNGEASKRSKGKAAVPNFGTINNFFKPLPAIGQRPPESQSVSAAAKTKAQDSGQGSSTQPSLNLNVSKSQVAASSSKPVLDDHGNGESSASGSRTIVID